MKKTKIKAWAVIWTKESMPSYGITEDNRIVIAETSDAETKKQKYMIIEFPLFKGKQNAERFRAKNKEWKVVPCIITFKRGEKEMDKRDRERN
jgi:hypothetical protein